MRKYWAVIVMSFQNTVINRGAVVLWRLGNIISLAAMIAVWMNAKANGLIGGYTKSELVAYYFAAMFLYSFVWWFPLPVIREEVNDGYLGPRYLLKPISHYWHKLSEEIGWHFVSIIAGTALIVIPAIVLWGEIHTSFALASLLPALVATVLGAILCFNFAYCLGLLSFWTTEVYGIGTFFWAGVNLLGGHAFPISFYPGAIKTIVGFLPFRYIFSFSLEIFSGRSKGIEMLTGFAVQLLWIIAFGLLAKLIWRIGVRKFSASGG